jgi:hypothetical protein
MEKAMTKTPSKNQTQQEPGRKPPREFGADLIRLATLIGIVALLAASFLIWRSVDQVRKGLDGRLTKIENQLAQVSGKVDTAIARNQPQQRGPDPNRVYTINAAGSPAQGPAGAPVVIAEFSDFQ